MKNLKKVLALALAVIMVMSMFTVAFAAETKTIKATDFSDYADIDYKEAVALCVDLGIISGIANDDGTYKFDPKGNIDRASWAKLLYFVATGDDNADAYKGASTGMTDIAGNWAEGFIAYCVSNGYLAGDGAGHYLPANTTTVAAGLKTLLCVLGYDAEDRGYVGSNAWEGNVMTDAKKNNLMDDVAKSNTSKVTLTREVAAQMIYNALQAQTVEPEKDRDNGEWYVKGYTKGNTLGYDNFDILAYDVIITEIDADGNAKFNNAKFNGYEITAAPTMLGETVTLFYNRVDKKPVSTYVASANNGAALSFTDGLTALGSLFSSSTAKTNDESDKYVGAKASHVDADSQTIVYDVEYYVDGAKDDDFETDFNTSYPNGIPAGYQVDVYTNDDDKVSMVKLTTWTVAKISDAPTTKEKSDEELYVKVPGISALNNWNNKAANVYGWEGLEKNDIVLVNADTSGIYTILKAEKTNGSVSKKTNSKLTVDGTAYAISDIAYAGGDVNENGAPGIDDWDVKDNKDNTYDFYLDLNGDIAYVVLVEGEVETAVAYVLESAWVAGSGINGSKYGEAKLLFTDGTVEVVTLGKYSSDDGAGDSYAKIDQTETEELAGKFITYSIASDGKYKVTPTEKTDSDYTVGTVDNGASIDDVVTFDSTAKANSKTVFFVEKYDEADDESTYHIFTGYKNVPEMKNAGPKDSDGTAQDTAMILDDGVALYVFLRTETGFAGDTPDGYVYVADVTDFYQDADGLYIQTMYDAEGNEIEMALTGKLSDSAEGFYTVKTVNEENGNVLDNTDISDKFKTLSSIGNDVVVVDSKVYAYDEETIFVVVDIDDEGKFDGCYAFDPENFSIDSDDYASVTAYFAEDLNPNDTADFVYVIRTAKTVE